MENHSHSHSHMHEPGEVLHSHAPPGQMRTAFFLTFAILLVEVTGGILSHSLALLSDAGHVLTDIAAIGLSWFALRQAGKPADGNMTFGYYRAGVLAALVNGILLMAVMLGILWEAYRRFQHPEPVRSEWMFISAGVGLLINLYLGLGMRREGNINVRSVVLHMFGDVAASAGVIVGGLIIMLTKWYVVDSILSVLIALLIAIGGWRIIRQTVLILMEGAPPDVKFQRVIEEIKATPSVSNVHDLHIWCITTGKNALSCHVVCADDMTIGQSQALLADIEHRLVHLGINHVTLQVENPDHEHDDSAYCTF